VDRKNILLAAIDKQGAGLEIGPSHRPAAPKAEGYNVDIIDHLTREELVEKYQTHGLDLDAIEEVDFVWSGESYADLTGNKKHYDWIIASHVIEHTPDLIGFLLDCDEVLKDGGVVSLAVPDKRYCFDHYRPITGIGSVIDRHLTGDRLNSAGSVAEYVLNVVKKSGAIAWHAKSEGDDYDFIGSVEQAKRQMNSVIVHSKYIDCHAWCFVPHSFRLLIHDLHSLGFLPFTEVAFTSTHGSEFYVTLGRNGPGIEKSRMQMLKEIEAEMLQSQTAAA